MTDEYIMCSNSLQQVLVSDTGLQLHTTDQLPLLKTGVT